MCKGKILVAEDDLVTLRLLIDDFTDAGYTVLPYSDGSEVVDMAIKNVPDLIVLDLLMPHVDGYTIAGKLRGHPVTSHIPIVVVSAVDPETALGHEVIMNCVERLRKPVDMCYLLSKVEKYVLAGRAVKSLRAMQNRLTNNL